MIFAINWFRLTELVIVTIFATFVFAATLFYQELDNQIRDLIDVAINEDNKFEQDFYSAQILRHRLEGWKQHHHLVCCLVDSINSVFGLILLLICGQVVMEMIVQTGFIIIGIFQSGFEFEPQDHLIRYIHAMLRLLTISTSSWYLTTQVIQLRKHYFMIGN